MNGTLLDPALTLARSWRYCEQLTRSEARNFYYGLRLLPEPKRSAMFALYAYMRLVDDIADAEDGRTHDQRVAELEAWQAQTHAAIRGRPSEDDRHPPEGDGHPYEGDARPPGGDGHAIWPAFAATVRRYAIPPTVFDEVIAGQRQDLEPIDFQTFPQLREYCYRVAGVVGLGCIHIWGFEGGRETEEMAVDRGVAFQLTNILRDVRQDAVKGRCYLPRQELAAMHVTDEDLRTGPGGKHFLSLMRHQIDRAASFYEKSAKLEDRIPRDTRPTLIAMTAIYRCLLHKVARRPERVLRQRVSLSLPSKLFIGWRALRAR